MPRTLLGACVFVCVHTCVCACAPQCVPMRLCTCVCVHAGVRVCWRVLTWEREDVAELPGEWTFCPPGLWWSVDAIRSGLLGSQQFPHHVFYKSMWPQLFQLKNSPGALQSLRDLLSLKRQQVVILSGRSLGQMTRPGRKEILLDCGQLQGKG